MFQTDAVYNKSWQATVARNYKTVDYPVDKILASDGTSLVKLFGEDIRTVTIQQALSMNSGVPDFELQKQAGAASQRCGCVGGGTLHTLTAALKTVCP